MDGWDGRNGRRVWLDRTGRLGIPLGVETGLGWAEPGNGRGLRLLLFLVSDLEMYIFMLNRVLCFEAECLDSSRLVTILALENTWMHSSRYLPIIQQCETNSDCAGSNQRWQWRRIGILSFSFSFALNRPFLHKPIVHSAAPELALHLRLSIVTLASSPRKKKRRRRNPEENGDRKKRERKTCSPIVHSHPPHGPSHHITSLTPLPPHPHSQPRSPPSSSPSPTSSSTPHSPRSAPQASASPRVDRGA